MRCGRASCACHSDPPHLHGPYWQWTRKVAGKTVTRYISPQTASDYQSWLENDRRIRELDPMAWAACCRRCLPG
jgi:hypothetical protein